MKTIVFFVLIAVIVPFSWSADWENYEVIDRLLTSSGPGAPMIYDNFAIFTADSSLRRVGVAFAHENFGNVYWYTPLLVSQDRMNPVILPGQRFPDPYKDSGIQFYVYQIPDNLKNLEYRIVVNGLWTTDPLNPLSKRDSVSGLTMSVISLPQRHQRTNPLDGLPEGLIFSFKGPPGETITVAGNFNGWDPFMYELKERSPGVYSIIIPLPPGTYQYVFFYRGRRYADPQNPKRVYAKDGSAASEITVP